MRGGRRAFERTVHGVGGAIFVLAAACMAGCGTAADIEEIKSTVIVESSSRSAIASINQQIRVAGWTISAWSLIVRVVGVAIILAVTVSVVLGNVLLGVAGAVGVVVIFRLFMSSRIDKRESQFETQLVDAMELAARSLRAGHPLFGAFQLISEEMSWETTNKL